MRGTGARHKARHWKVNLASLRRLDWKSAEVILVVILVALFIGSFVISRYPISPADVVKVLASRVLPVERTWPDTLDTVIIQVRLPRMLAAMMVGASLSLDGASFQGLFRNPLVSPDILGVSSGAGFGAALAILLSGSQWSRYDKKCRL